MINLTLILRTGIINLITIRKSDFLYSIVLLFLAGILGWNTSYYGLEGDISSSFQAWNRQITTLKMTGEFPLWDQQSWGGMTFIGQIMQPFYPILWVLKYLFFSHVDNTLSISILFAMSSVHMVIFSLGLYFFLRVNKYSEFSSFFVALMISCTSIVYSLWPFIWAATSYTPFLLLFTILLIKNINSTNMSFLHSFVIGFILSMVFFVAGVWVGLSALYVVFLVLFYFFEDFNNKKKIIRLLLFLSFAAFISFLIAAVQILPMLELVLRASRYIPKEGFIPVIQKVLYSTFIEHSVPVSEMTNLMTKDGKVGVGLVLYVFMLIGFFHKSNNFILKYARFLFVFGLLSTFGIVLPLILYYIPVVNSIRELFLYAPFIGIAVSILAAEGIEYLLKNPQINFKDLFFVPLFLFLLALIFFKEFIFNIETIIIFFILILLIVINLFKNNSNKVILYISIGLLFVLASISYYSRIISNNQFAYNSIELEKRYKAHKESLKPLLSIIDEKIKKDYFPPYRIMVWTAELGIGDIEMFGHRDVYTYLNPVDNAALAIHGMNISKRAIIQNAKYLLIQTQNQYWLDLVKTYGYENLGTVEYEKAFDGGFSNSTVFETNAVGEAWFVDDIYPYDFQLSNKGSYKEQVQKVDFINKLSFNPLKTAIVNVNDYEELLSKINISEKYTNNKLNLIKITANNITYDAYCEENKLMVTSNFRYPGWNVYVDGKKTSSIEVNSAFLGILLNKGTHTVELRYESLSFKIGIYLQLLIIILVLIYLFYNILNSFKFKIKEINK